MTSYIPSIEWRRVWPRSAGADRALENRASCIPDRMLKGKCPCKKGRQKGLEPPLDGRLSARDIGVLVKRIQAGDPDARNTLILANSRLVAKIAHRYTSCGSPLADLMQAGFCGLIRAAERYNPATQHAPFSSYAASGS